MSKEVGAIEFGDLGVCAPQINNRVEVAMGGFSMGQDLFQDSRFVLSSLSEQMSNISTSNVPESPQNTSLK